MFRVVYSLCIFIFLYIGKMFCDGNISCIIFFVSVFCFEIEWLKIFFFFHREGEVCEHSAEPDTNISQQEQFSKDKV